MKKKAVFLLALSVILLFATSINSTLAYFTSYVQAVGGYVVYLPRDPGLTETFYDWTKHVTISIPEDAYQVYVRVKAFAGSEYVLTYIGDGWTLNSDGFYYYDEILYGGWSTNELLVRIENIPENAVPGESFNVIVIYETTPVQYDENGNPYSDWTLVATGGDEG